MLILFAAIAAAVPRSPCADHAVPAIDMTGDLRGQDLMCADLRLLDLRDADFTGAILTGAWLHGADLRGANFTDAQMGFTHLEGADLRDANLTDAYLRRAVVRGANVYGANLTRTDLCWVDLTTIEFITAAQTPGTRYCRSTTRTDELFRPDEEYDWQFKPFFREPRQNLVTLNALDGLSLTRYDNRRSTTGSGDIRLFEALATTVGVNVFGAEFVPPFLDASHRHTLSAAGLSLGLGFGNGQFEEENFSFVTISGGPFIRPLSFIQLEAGFAAGYVVNDVFAERSDAAVYYGVRVNIRPLVALLDDLAEVAF